MRTYGNGISSFGRLVSILFFFNSIFFPGSLLAQNSESTVHIDRLFTTGIELFEKKNYGAARKAFEDFLKICKDEGLSAEAGYYRAFCAIHLFHDDGEFLLNDFVRQYSGHPKSNYAYLELAEFYYRNKDYKKATLYFNKVNLSAFNDEQLCALRFKNGYAWFNLKNDSLALEHFRFVTTKDNVYKAPSAYYAGYIELNRKNYDQSLGLLQLAEKDETYAGFVPSMIQQVYYEKKDYEKVIQYGNSVLKADRVVKEKNNMILMMADAYYYKGDYEESNRYFNEYLSSPSAVVNAEILLRAGVSAYHTGYYVDAVDFLKKAALDTGNNGQLASYYLGHSYIPLDNKPYAIAAFNSARITGNDIKTKEEATFYFGKLSFESGNFSEAVDAFTTYNSNFKNGVHTQEANELLSESYLRSENYDQAITYLQSLPALSARMKEIFQKVTFKKGTQLFNAGKYADAVSNFQKSLNYQQDRETMLSAFLWMGETYSIGKKYEEAISAYSGVFRNDPSGISDQNLRARYGIAYAYYNTGIYDKALGHFKAYTDRLKREGKTYFYNDAILRLADCYYATKDYSQAIVNYETALQRGNTEKDYCYFQLGIVHGIQVNLQLAFKNLDMVISQFPGSVYYDDAVFQKAQLTFESGDYETAIGRFTSLVESQPQSVYIPHALIGRAISALNLKRFEVTISDYKQVIKNYPRHPVANSALLGLQEVLALAGKENEFDEYLAIYKEANPGNRELANVEFEAAKTLYYNQKYSGAIESLEKFAVSYPSSPFDDEVFYYLGDSYYRSDNIVPSIENFKKVLAFENSKWYNRSVQRIADLYLRSGNPKESIVYYQKLKVLAGNRREEYNVWSGLMEAYYQASQFDSAIYCANRVIESGGLTAGGLNKAQLLVGKSLLRQGKDDEAMDYFLNTVNNAKDESGAEAQYLVAGIFNKRKEYVLSNETLFNLNENYAVYEYWVGKSFLLIADNFIAMGETFQAQATLNSIIEKSPEKEIVELAKAKMNSLEVAVGTKNDTIK